VMAPRGLATAFSMVIVGRLVGKTDARLLVGCGMLLSALGSHAMTRYSLDINTFWIIWPAMLQGLGLGLIFVPLSTIAYATLERSRMAEAAGLYSLVRTMGSAIGISVITTILSRQSQVMWNELGGHVQRYNPALAEYLRPLHLAPTDPRAIALIAGQVAEQAQVAAMLDVFKLITWSFVLMLPLVFVLRRSRPATNPMASVPPE
jgi:DHA2 family multidrug resistance protein